jgi:23S rRNA (pseudouridine1915-N3)-methyltransferase
MLMCRSPSESAMPPSIATVRIVVVAVGRLRPPYQDDIQHYRDLIAPHVRLELVEVKENEQVSKRIPERAFTVFLDEGGKTFSSEKFAGWLEDRRMDGRDLCFVVGGPYGTQLDRPPDMTLSFGPMTLPHQLARVVLLEQLYRAHKILAGHPYHH